MSPGHSDPPILFSGAGDSRLWFSESLEQSVPGFSDPAGTPDAPVPGCFDTAGPGRMSRPGGSGPGPAPVFCSSFGTLAGADLFAIRWPVTFAGLLMQISL
jgi:hypothetical protein